VRSVALAQTIAHTVVAHPDLIRWYLHTRARRKSLVRELENRDGVSSRPLGITLKPTYSCNLRCSMCSFAATGAVEAHPRDSLPVETWARLIEDVTPYRPYVWFTGGEPTLYPSFIPLLRKVLECGLLCGVTSNGTTLERLANDIAAHPMHVLVVSVDGGPEVHNRVRGLAVAYERVRAGLAALRDACRRQRTRHPALVLNCSLSPDNYRDPTGVTALAEEFHAECINVQHLWMMTEAMVAAQNERWADEQPLDAAELGATGPPDMDPEVVVKTVAEIRRASPRVPVFVHPDLSEDETRIYYTEPERFVHRTRAACAWINTDVLPNGDISPCFGVVCGNITRDRFMDVWNGEAFQRHRQRLSVEGDLPICARCCAYWRRD
jgi:MoaA/NifB/PqqE/SkfB family radical SAM enzyme